MICEKETVLQRRTLQNRFLQRLTEFGQEILEANIESLKILYYFKQSSNFSTNIKQFLEKNRVFFVLP